MSQQQEGMSEPPLTDEQLSEIEARASRRAYPGHGFTAPETPPGFSYFGEVEPDALRLVAEVRRLRSLFTEQDAGLLEHNADYFERDTELYGPTDVLNSDQLLNLARRIRQAIGEAGTSTTWRAADHSEAIAPELLTQEKPPTP